MGKSRCISNIKTIHKFLNATGGNWRNSVYIECTHCQYGRGCRDYLFTPAEDGTPILLPVSDVEILTATAALDKSECLIHISNLRFAELYQKWLKALSPDPASCPIRQVIVTQNPPENW